MITLDIIGLRDWLGSAVFTCTVYHTLSWVPVWHFVASSCCALPYDVPFKSNLKTGLFHVLYTVISCQISIRAKLQLSDTRQASGGKTVFWFFFICFEDILPVLLFDAILFVVIPPRIYRILRSVTIKMLYELICILLNVHCSCVLFFMWTFPLIRCALTFSLPRMSEDISERFYLKPWRHAWRARSSARHTTVMKTWLVCLIHWAATELIHTHTHTLTNCFSSLRYKIRLVDWTPFHHICVTALI